MRHFSAIGYGIVGVMLSVTVLHGLASGSAAECPPGKVAICHRPPGTPENGQAICVGAAAAERHLEAHEGDALIDKEVCDGLDNDCDGIIDNVGDALCDACDLSGIDFGPCDAVLGWGGIDGRCQEISGCESPVPLFDSEEACRRECLCRDLSGIDFGPCEALLGYGVIDGVCSPIAGCPPSPVPLFGSPAACRATCTPRCGGIAGLTCPDDLVCIDEPGDDCDPACGGADCGGVCVLQDPDQSFCGGIAGFPCPAGFVCVDDPADNCSPNCGGADCGGICVKR